MLELLNQATDQSNPTGYILAIIGGVILAAGRLAWHIYKQPRQAKTTKRRTWPEFTAALKTDIIRQLNGN